jgi:hypothetical protein
MSVKIPTLRAMTAATQSHRYAAPSAPADGRLGLSTSGGRTRGGPAVAPRFFSGVVTRPDAAAAALLAIADVAQARYHRPRPHGSASARDPVATRGGARLRFESFSGCGGVYARLDLLGAALDGEVFDPRLAGAHELVAADAVTLVRDAVGTVVSARVRTAWDVHEAGLAGGSCTCRWWREHRGARGPCRHVLAARIAARARTEVAR